MNFIDDFNDYIGSGHALIHVNTSEKDRAISQIVEAANIMDRKVYIWSITEGWRDINGVEIAKMSPSVPIEQHLAPILEFGDGIILVMKDFGPYTRHETYPAYDVVNACLDDLRKIIPSVRQNIVFVGSDFEPPKTLKNEITTIEFDLPDKQQIEERVQFVCSDVVKADGTKFEPNPSAMSNIVDACRGMTSQQVGDRVALALRRHKDLTPDAVKTITREKAGIIRASGLLTYIEPPEGGLNNVGGYDAIKKHVQLDKPCFTDEAREFGIEFPRGLMLVGISGCGKTLLSLAIASELGLPLIAMDVGNLMDKYVGESETNMRDAIKLMERIAPCVLQLDEIEKGFGGAGDMDGGSSRRVFGTFIKWLNDRDCPLYAVATANQVQSLPPEFCRKGRFDEIYGLDLPGTDERKEIFYIHLAKRGRNPGDFNMTELSQATEGYTGADIEQVVKLGLKIAFSRGSQLTQSHIQEAIPEIIPLSKTEANRIADIKEWCKGRAKPASKEEAKSTNKRSRKVELN